MKKIISVFGVILSITIITTFYIAPGFIEKSQNKVISNHSNQISDKANSIHQKLIIMDWHSDSLLWDPNLLQKGDYGHVDIPRLQQGNVAIQMFTVVTKSQSDQNYISNKSDSDNITKLAIAQLWPFSTWNSLFKRALYQAEKLKEFSARSPENLKIVRSKSDLAEAIANHPQGSQILGLIGLEGSHALEGEISNVQVLFDAGYRMISLHHFFDNELGGSLHGMNESGLTNFGKNVVKELERLNIIIDVAHSHPNVVEDVLNTVKRPVVVSHTGTQSHHKSPRNISDTLMKKIADKGGIIALGYWSGAIGNISPENVVKAIKTAIKVVGVNHVALGSDFDGSTTTSFDTSELAILTQTMLKNNFTEAEITKISGENSIAFLMKNLPD